MEAVAVYPAHLVNTFFASRTISGPIPIPGDRCNIIIHCHISPIYHSFWVYALRANVVSFNHSSFNGDFNCSLGNFTIMKYTSLELLT